MQSARGKLWALIILAGLLLACAAALIVLRLTPAAGNRRLLATRRIAVDVSDARLSVSWRPKVSYRPAWAGQINRHGLRYNRWSDGSAEVALPLWWPAAACAVTGLAIAWFARRLRHTPTDGLCPRCSYDLRATPQRCPECGYTAADPESKV